MEHVAGKGLDSHLRTGAALRREDISPNTFGSPLAPNDDGGLSSGCYVCSICPDVLVFILKRRAHLVFASTAGIGGYLSQVVFSAVLEKEITNFEYLFWLIDYGLPKILVSLYEKVRAYIDAVELRRITRAERVCKVQEKPE